MTELQKFAKAYVGGKGPKFKVLKRFKVPLSPEERALVMARGATWNNHPDPKKNPIPAVWKSIVNGKTWYVTNTHRAYNVTPTLKGTINRYHAYIKGTA